EGMSAQVEPHTMIEGPSSPYKVVWIVRFKQGMDRAEGRAYWRNTHGPIFKNLDIDRYVQNHAVAPVGGGGEARDPLRFDGFSEGWFKDEALFLLAVESATLAGALDVDEDIIFMHSLCGAVLCALVVNVTLGE